MNPHIELLLRARDQGGIDEHTLSAGEYGAVQILAGEDLLHRDSDNPRMIRITAAGLEQLERGSYGQPCTHQPLFVVVTDDVGLATETNGLGHAFARVHLQTFDRVAAEARATRLGGTVRQVGTNITGSGTEEDPYVVPVPPLHPVVSSAARAYIHAHRGLIYSAGLATCIAVTVMIVAVCTSPAPLVVLLDLAALTAAGIGHVIAVCRRARMWHELVRVTTDRDIPVPDSNRLRWARQLAGANHHHIPSEEQL